MSENTNSATDNESPKVEPNPKPNPNQKRGSDSEDQPDGIVVKKAKTEAFFEIEADAAEDKGSRHTMEDAWVVLLDAAADSPGKLRSFIFFLILFIYLSCIVLTLACVGILMCVSVRIFLNTYDFLYALANLGLNMINFVA